MIVDHVGRNKLRSAESIQTLCYNAEYLNNMNYIVKCLNGDINALVQTKRFLNMSQRNRVVDGLAVLSQRIALMEVDNSNVRENMVKVYNDADSMDTKIIGVDGMIKNTSPSPPAPPVRPPSPPSLPYVLANRIDLIGQYIGHTSKLTTEFLLKNLGKVVIIDEAYDLIHDSKDSFGMEALTVINRFMSERPGDIIFILAGYKSHIEKNIFENQRGLESRCSWFFEIDNYTPLELKDIFIHHLNEMKWTVDGKVNLNTFFINNKDTFRSFGRDVKKLLLQCTLIHGYMWFGVKQPQPRFITREILDDALVQFKSQQHREGNLFLDYMMIT